MQFEVHVSAKFAGKRLDLVLAEELDQTRSAIQKWIDAKRVTLNGKVAQKSGLKVSEGDSIHGGVPDQTQSKLKKSDLQLNILYEDEDLIVINKPAGIVVHPDSTGHQENTIANALLTHLEKEAKASIKGQKKRATVPEESPFLSDCDGHLRPGIVHRLDKDTSGALILAKNAQSHHQLSKSFEQRKVSKEYLALVHGHPKSNAGKINAPIQRSSHKRQQMAIGRAGRDARTAFEVEEQFSEKKNLPLPCTLLKVKIETGRTHQIRVHMASIGHPVLGDSTYGRKAANQTLEKKTGLKRQFLHAFELSFPHPTSGELLKVQAPLPEDLENTLTLLRAE